MFVGLWGLLTGWDEWGAWGWMGWDKHHSLLSTIPSYLVPCSLFPGVWLVLCSLVPSSPADWVGRTPNPPLWGLWWLWWWCRCLEGETLYPRRKESWYLVSPIPEEGGPPIKPDQLPSAVVLYTPPLTTRYPPKIPTPNLPNRLLSGIDGRFTTTSHTDLLRLGDGSWPFVAWPT